MSGLKRKSHRAILASLIVALLPVLSCSSAPTTKGRTLETGEIANLAPWLASRDGHIQIELTTLLGVRIQGRLMAVTDSTLIITPNLIRDPRSEEYDAVGRPRHHGPAATSDPDQRNTGPHVDVRDQTGEPLTIRKEKIRGVRRLE